MSESRLENALLALIVRAEAEGRRDTAEHLMRALEALYAGTDGAASGPPPARGASDARPRWPLRGSHAAERGGRSNE